MRAMVFEGVGRPLRPVERPMPRARARAAAAAGAGVRGVPHRPAPARRRGGDRAPAAHPRPPDRGHGRATRWRRAARRRAVAGLDVRRMRVLPLGPREPVPARALHRPRHRRRDGRVRRRRRALLLPDPRRLPGRAGGAAAVRRADRLPRAAHVRRRRGASGCTGSARPPTSSPGRAAAGPASVRVHPRGRRARRRRSRASSARSGPGDSEQPPPRAARRGDHLRARRLAGAARAARARAGRDGRVRQAST